MVTTWTNVLNGAATTVGATPGDAVPATLLADVLQISNSGTGIDATLRDVGDGDGTTVPLKVSTSAVMLPHAAIWPYGDSTFFSAGQTGILIPYYIYPNNPYSDTTVTRLLGLIRQYRGRVPVIVVINPSSGPGTVMDGNYSAFIKLIQAAGGKVAGYVSTTYSGTITPFRTEAQVKADIDTWMTLYADTPIDTIFLDEMSYDLGTNNEYVALYKRYTDYCHARNLAPVIANPGTNQQGAWFAERTADIIVVAETGTWPTESDMLGAYIGGHIDYKTSLRAALVYAQSSLTPGKVRQLAKYVQWVYATGDALSPNPWDSLSAHLEQTFAILAGEAVFDVTKFGAIGDGVVDDSTALQAALTAANTAGGGVVFLPAGTFRKADTTASLIMYSNTTIAGVGDASILFHDDTIANARSDLLVANGRSNIGFRDFKILGTADTYGVQTNQSQCLTGAIITNLRCENVTFQGLRYMSTAFNRVNGGIFSGNRLKNCMRDGIRCTHSYDIIVNGNTFDNVSDDNVALHSVDAYTEPVGSGFVVTNNVFTAGQSVKILGGKRVVISGNTFSRMLRTPINVTLEYGLTEGASPLLDVSITNNVIQDTFSAFGSNEIIKVVSYPYSKGGLTVQPGINATPYAYNWLNNIDTGTQPNVGAANVRIENNTISRTLAPVATYSLYGFGSLYDTAYTWGYDPAIADTNFACHGISVYGPVRGLRLCGNMIAGLGITVFAMRLTCDSASTYPDFIDAVIDGNVVSDCPGGGLSIIGGDTSAARNLVIRNNVFNVDPFIRQTAHATDNTWTDITSSPGIQTTLNIKGCVVTGNWFSHCASPIGPNISGVAYVRDNFVLCDATSIANDALNKGVRNLTKQYDFVHIKYDGDPTSATYGEISSMPLSTSSSIPTSGWYATGHYTKSASNVPGSTGYVLGWLRLTTGTAHVTGTDWAVVTIPAYDGSTLSLPVLTAAPASPVNGMLAYADGAGWNPGAGAGVYARQAGAWVKL